MNVTTWMEQAYAQLPNVTPPPTPVQPPALIQFANIASLVLHEQVAVNPAQFVDVPLPITNPLIQGIGAIGFGSFASPNFLNGQQVIPWTPTGQAVALPASVNEIYFHVFLPSSPRARHGISGGDLRARLRRQPVGRPDSRGAHAGAGRFRHHRHQRGGAWVRAAEPGDYYGPVGQRDHLDRGRARRGPEWRRADRPVRRLPGDEPGASGIARLFAANGAGPGRTGAHHPGRRGSEWRREAGSGRHQDLLRGRIAGVHVWHDLLGAWSRRCALRC